jgi:hypothetical protein
MNDINQLLAGTVEDVKSRLTDLGAADLKAKLTAEQAGKNRKGVIDALEEAHTAATTKAVTYTATTDRGDASAATTSADVSSPAVAVTTAASLDRSGDAHIAPATEFDPAGAPVQSSGFDLDHVALDTNPRANTSADQNRIDFNDPTIDGAEAVRRNLGGGEASAEQPAG